MGQPGLNAVDKKTINDTLTAFEDTMANTNAAIQAVEAVSSSVPWQGEAAVRYRQALNNWVGGVQQVRNGLEQLRQSMTQHLHISSNAEEEAATMSQWYA